LARINFVYVTYYYIAKLKKNKHLLRKKFKKCIKTLKNTIIKASDTKTEKRPEGEMKT